MVRPGFRVPHTLVLLAAMIVAAQLLTYVLPAGSFERVENEHGAEQVVPGTFAPALAAEPLGPFAALTAVPRGFAAARDIIFFVFIVGGAFAVLRATGAVDAALGVLLRRLGGRPFWLIAGGVLAFAVGSSTIGMAEEYLPFVPILVALALALRFDAVTGVGIMVVGYGIGYGTAAINPFTVLIAQDVAGLPPASGLGFRLVLLGVFLPIGVHHVWRYAERVRREPAASYVADVPRLAEPPAGYPAPTRRHALVLVTVVALIVLLVWGLARWGWYLEEMGALFLGMTLLLALIARLGADRTARTFAEGATELTTTALLIGFARTIQVVLQDGVVIDTIVHGISLPLQAAAPAVAAVGMLLVQTVTNLFIPSGSGQAYVTMPIMAPLADLVGVTRQVAVLAYQFGDGFANTIVPTNPVLVGILAMAGIPYDRWLRFIAPFMAKVLVVGALALAVAVAVGYGQG
jgi:uncharacterized ion transporter superfamily protein YfcC